MMWSYNNSDDLYHYGILGMKWGKRKSRQDRSAFLGKVKAKKSELDNEIEKHASSMHKSKYYNKNRSEDNQSMDYYNDVKSHQKEIDRLSSDSSKLNSISNRKSYVVGNTALGFGTSLVGSYVLSKITKKLTGSGKAAAAVAAINTVGFTALNTIDGYKQTIRDGKAICKKYGIKYVD